VQKGGDCMKNAHKPSKPLFRNGERRVKVIWNPYVGSNQHQKLISSSDW